MNKPIQIIVGAGGSNPASGSTVWNNTTLSGQDGWIEKSGYGPLKYDDYQVLSTGGVQLLNGLAFGADGEVYFWHSNGLAYETTPADYTNGFNYSAVINALVGRIGFRAETQSGYTGLVDSTNQLARSGRYYNDFHAVVSAANLKDVQADKGISNINFNAYLQSLQKSVALRFVNAVFPEREYIEQRMTFDKAFNTPDQSVPNENKFVGFCIQVAQRFDIAVQIDGATLLFDSDISALPLYLFKDGKKTPVWTASVDVTAYENTLVTFSNLVLNYINSSTKGDRYFFGYFQNDLGTAKAIRHTSCWNKSYAYSITGMSAAKLSGNDFKRDEVSTVYESFGINLELSAFRDHTQAIVKKANLFDEGVGLTMAYAVIEQVVYSMRGNGSERLLRSGITEAALLQDLTGSAPVSDGPPPITGLNKRIEREAKAVKHSFNRIAKAQTVNLC